jgi:hypothetical protein
MKQKTAMQQIFERINLWLPINDPLRMELESDMAMWLEKEKQQIINAVEWDYKSNMGEVYYEAMYGVKDEL